MNDLQISIVQWGWIMGMFTLAHGLFEIPTGWLGDRIGGKSVDTGGTMDCRGRSDGYRRDQK